MGQVRSDTWPPITKCVLAEWLGKTLGSSGKNFTNIRDSAAQLSIGGFKCLSANTTFPIIHFDNKKGIHLWSRQRQNEFLAVLIIIRVSIYRNFISRNLQKQLALWVKVESTYVRYKTTSQQSNPQMSRRSACQCTALVLYHRRRHRFSLLSIIVRTIW